MARLPFTDAGSRLALTADGKPALGRTYTVYANLDGTTLADIVTDAGGVPGASIPTAQLVTDAYGYLPRFWGPTDGTDRLYATDGIAPITRIDADFDARLDAITASAVTSVAGRSGAVTLTATDVAGVETAADSQAKAAAAAAALAAHEADTTAVHGIANTAVLETTSGAQAKADTAQAAAIAAAATDATTKANAAQSASLQKTSNLSDLANAGTARTNLGLGASATRNIGTTAGTVPDGADARFTDARDPNAHSGTHAVAGSDPVQLAQAQVTGLTGALAAKADLVGGKVPTSQIPAVAINTTFTVASQAAMLALGATQGDVAIRTDFTPARSYQLAAADPTVLANWIQVDLGGVTSVNAQTGVVVLAASDVGAPPTSRQVTAGTGLTGGGDLTTDRTLSVVYGTTSGSAAQGNDSRITGALQAASNLSDLGSASTARTNLGLGNSATRAVGTTANTVAAGDDSRITGAAQKSANLSDLGSPSTARTNLGLGGSATLNVGTAAGTVAAGDDARFSAAAQKSANLSDLASAANARTNLGVASVVEAPTNPLRYGAVGDGTTLDDAAFTAMMAALPSFGGHVFLPPNYHFRLSQTVTLKDKCRWEGGGLNSQITNSATDMFTCSAPLSWMQFSHMRLNAGSGGGHMFALGLNGMSKSVFDNLVLTINSAAKSLIVADWWLDNTISNSWLYGANNRSEPLLKLISTTDNLSDNTFHDLVITDAGTATTWAIWLEETSANLAFSNRFRGINFENPCGGAITLRGHIAYLIENCQLWDLHVPANNHLIYCTKGSGSGLPNRNGRIRGIVRPSGSLGAGINDIAFGSVGNEYGTVVSECYGAGSGILRIDLQRNLGCRIEDCNINVSLQSYAPILTVGAGAGSGATATLSPNVPGLYTAGVSVTTGTGTAAGSLVTVTANVNGWMTATPAAVLLTPKNAAAAAAGLYVTSVTATGFTVSSANAVPASTVCTFGYHVVPNVSA